MANFVCNYFFQQFVKRLSGDANSRDRWAEYILWGPN